MKSRAKKSKDPLNANLIEIKIVIAEIKAELKLHRWLLGLIFGMIVAILVKALFF